MIETHGENVMSQPNGDRPAGPAYLPDLARPTAVQLAAWVRCTPDADMPVVVRYLEGILTELDEVHRVRGLLAVALLHSTPLRKDTPT